MSEDRDTPIAERIERWTVRAATPWEAIVGHAPQIRRLQEIALRLALSDEERERLRLRVGAGLAISGPPGTGKTLLARAFATSIGRLAIAPPVSELTPALLDALYAELAHRDPVVVLLDEADGLLDRQPEGDDIALGRTLLTCLDGITRPAEGPVTIALTTLPLYRLSGAATRPGRLSPRILLEAPTAEDRRVLLERLIEGLPVIGPLDIDVIVERTVTWTGAELAGIVEEAVGRSLRAGPRGLLEGHVLEVVGERFIVTEPDAGSVDVELFAVHEAGHALYATLTWGPGAVGVVRLDDGGGGETELAPHLIHRRRTVEEIRREAAMAIAGTVAEELALGTVSQGSESDLAGVTDRLSRARLLGRPFDEAGLEAGDESDRGSDRMRMDRFLDIAREAELVRAEVRSFLAPHRAAIVSLAAAIRDAERQTLSGSALANAIEAALADERGALPREDRAVAAFGHRAPEGA